MVREYISLKFDAVFLFLLVTQGGDWGHAVRLTRNSIFLTT